MHFLNLSHPLVYMHFVYVTECFCPKPLCLFCVRVWVGNAPNPFEIILTRWHIINAGGQEVLFTIKQLIIIVY